jgi:hypothetical protein
VSRKIETPRTRAVYYTVGWWNASVPIEVQLTQGKNTLTFTRTR